VYLLAICTHVGACGDATDPAESHLAQTNGAYWTSPAPTASAPRRGVSQPADFRSDDANENEQTGECPAACVEKSSCGQICIELKGHGSSCQLVPTANDLTRPPRSVHFDCDEISLGPDGYDFDSLGHLTLMGNTCSALHSGGPRRITLTLGCPPPI
jgi:hypothetical protein